MFDKNKQLNSGPPGTELANLDKYLQPVERAPLSTWLPKMIQRAYQPTASNEAARLELALANPDMVPTEHREGLYLFAMRQGGTRIGAKYGLVDMHTLARKAAALIPSMCMFLGVPFDNAYLAMAMGIAHHLRTNRKFQHFTLEELDNFPMQVFMIPLEAIPEAYQVFDMKAMAQVMEAYSMHVYGKQVGPAHGWLRDHVHTDQDKQQERLRLERAGIDPRYERSEDTMAQFPPDVQERLAAAYTKYLEQMPHEFQTHYLAARAACGADGTMLATFVVQCCLTISEPEQARAAKFAWQRALTESGRNNKAKEKRLLKAGMDGQLATQDATYLLRLVRMHKLAWQFREWKKKELTTPPQVVIKSSENGTTE